MRKMATRNTDPTWLQRHDKAASLAVSAVLLAVTFTLLWSSK